MVKYGEPVIVETIKSKDGRFKIEGMVIAGTRQSYVPSEWGVNPEYGYHLFTNENGTVAFATLEETKAFIEGVAAARKEA